MDEVGEFEYIDGIELYCWRDVNVERLERLLDDCDTCLYDASASTLWRNEAKFQRSHARRIMAQWTTEMSRASRR